MQSRLVSCNWHAQQAASGGHAPVAHTQVPKGTESWVPSLSCTSTVLSVTRVTLQKAGRGRA